MASNEDDDIANLDADAEFMLTMDQWDVVDEASGSEEDTVCQVVDEEFPEEDVNQEDKDVDEEDDVISLDDDLIAEDDIIVLDVGDDDIQLEDDTIIVSLSEKEEDALLKSESEGSVLDTASAEKDSVDEEGLCYPEDGALTEDKSERSVSVDDALPATADSKGKYYCTVTVF